MFTYEIAPVFILMEHECLKVYPIEDIQRNVPYIRGLKGIVRPFKLGGETRPIRSSVINWPDNTFS
jgi:hypothetical protein